jgi:hypothetical protein
MVVGGQRHAPADPPPPPPPGKRPGTHFIEGWVGPRAGLDGYGKSRPHTGILSQDRPARSELLCRLSYTGPQLTKGSNTMLAELVDSTLLTINPVTGYNLEPFPRTSHRQKLYPLSST